MKAEIISVGTELLRGEITNTNSKILASFLLDLGIEGNYQQVVIDKASSIKEALTIAIKRADLIILSGGLGPTPDDITKEVVAEFLSTHLVLDEEQWNYIQHYFVSQGRNQTPTDRRQALYFEGGVPFRTQDGLACGTAYKNENSQYFICLPGPPAELSAMLHQTIKPYLLSELSNLPIIQTVNLNFSGIGEAQLAYQIEDIMSDYNPSIIAIYSKPMQIRVRVTTKSNNALQAQTLSQEIADRILAKLDPYFIGYGENQTIETYIIEALTKRGQTLGISESLTGGQVSAALTEIPGASKVIRGALVTYQEQSKIDLLKIDPQVLQRYSVYSKECAFEMAKATQSLLQTDYSLSLTGVAGPGSDQGHPAGQVFVTVCGPLGTISSREYQIPPRGRHYVRELARKYALQQVKDMLELKSNKGSFIS
ncbi:competence/damage-inducible protein A [Facklamia sp. DSM 111018]|uniref:Putative competence-damage inducible protein n=1 Tax=Facklamia lactis TaxID=2749967 RepID=A0ABS0LPS3_9LACT|nr:competence/damage-inducible protein A [Facklamia lactis]MBG9985500.1 competence/damage-inducible protein A [Facklamia lactis]